MSGPEGSGDRHESIPEVWQVELSQDAAREVRNSPPVVRRKIASLLDGLARKGIPADADRSASGHRRFLRGDIEVLGLVEPDVRRILVARIRAVDRPPVRAALRATRLSPSTSSTLALVLDSAWHDVRYALRTFRRAPGFVLSVVTTLALALGGATAFVGLASLVFHGPLPFSNDEELLRLRDRRVTAGGEQRAFNMSPLNFMAIRERARTLQGVTASTGANIVLTGDELAQRVRGIRVSQGWGTVLGVEPLLGRLFTREEERLGGDAQVAVLSHTLWESRFGGDPGVIGRRVVHDAGAFTVVGVLQPRFRYPYDAELWLPGIWDPTNGASHDLNVVARMAAGASAEDVRLELAQIAGDLQSERPDTNADLFVQAESLRDDFVRDEGEVLLALLAAVAFLLVLACVNVTNLLVARFVERRREVSVRTALGGGRSRLARSYTLEALLLFGVGGALGLALSLWLGSALATLIPDVMRTQLDMSGLKPDLGLFAMSAGLALIVGLGFGAAAAWRGTRTDLTRALKDGGRGGSGRQATLQSGLVVTQLALSMALLIGASALFTHFRSLSSSEPGLDPADLYTLRLTLDQERYATSDGRVEAVNALSDVIANAPGVESVAITTVNPFCCGDWGAPIAVEGQTRPEGATHLVHHRLITPGYFRTTGTPLVLGRDFDERDAVGALPTVIIDEAMASRFWPDQDPVGQRIRLDRPGSPWRTVVGVVGDVDEEGDHTETWYWPYAQEPLSRSSPNIHFMIRGLDSGVLAGARRAVSSFDPNLAAYEMASMESLRQGLLNQDRVGAILGGVFAGFGLLLAALGVFAILSYNVGTRKREIGTRVALGALPRQVTAMVLRSAARMSLIGIAVGIGAALVLNRILQSLVEGVETAHSARFALLASILLGASLLAGMLPARGASRVDPMEAFRE